MDPFDPEKWPRFVLFPAFLRDWERLGFDAEDLRSLEIEILKDPSQAPVIKGTGGLRKLRFSGGNRHEEKAVEAAFAMFITQTLGRSR